MTIYAQTRREVSAEPQLHDRLRLAFHSIVQRLDEAVKAQELAQVEELLADLKDNRDAWNQAVLVGGEAPTNALSSNLQEPANHYTPQAQPAGLTDPVPEVPALAPAPAQMAEQPAQGIVPSQAADHAQPREANPMKGRLFR